MIIIIPNILISVGKQCLRAKEEKPEQRERNGNGRIDGWTNGQMKVWTGSWVEEWTRGFFFPSPFFFQFKLNDCLTCKCAFLVKILRWCLNSCHASLPKIGQRWSMNMSRQLHNCYLFLKHITLIWSWMPNTHRETAEIQCTGVSPHTRRCTKLKTLLWTLEKETSVLNVKDQNLILKKQNNLLKASNWYSKDH